MTALSSKDPDAPRSRLGITLPGGPRVVLFIVLGMLLLYSSVVRVATGHVGVLTLFSKVTGEILPEGLHLINPLKTSHELSIQTQTMKETASVPSNEGLVLTLDTSLIFHLDHNRAAQIYRVVGVDYREKIVENNLRSSIRGVTSKHSANALYTGAREEVAQQIQDELISVLAPQGIVIERVLLREVQLPALLRNSIEAKQQAEQDALRMSFILQKEKQEAERKRIEAQGIADFQRIVAQGLNQQLLEWKGIEATEKLAMSPNSKVVLIGNSRTGLPLILEPK
jgi:prohibitin 1